MDWLFYYLALECASYFKKHSTPSRKWLKKHNLLLSCHSTFAHATISHSFPGNFPFRGMERSCTTAGQIFLKCWGFCCWIFFSFLVFVVLLPCLIFPYCCSLGVWLMHQRRILSLLVSRWGKIIQWDWGIWKFYDYSHTHRWTHNALLFWWIVMFHFIFPCFLSESHCCTPAQASFSAVNSK